MIADILLGAVLGLAWIAAADILDRVVSNSDIALFHGSWSFYGAVLSGAIFLLSNGSVAAGVALLVTALTSLWWMILYRRQRDAQMRPSKKYDG